MRRAVALLLILCLVATARAEWPCDAVCDIVNQIGYESPGGSGTYVGAHEDNGVVITCAHIFEPSVGTPICTFEGEKVKYRGRVLGIDRAHDLAMILIGRPEKITPLRIARLNPDAGPFVSVGFPSHAQGRMFYRTGNLVGQTSGKAFTDAEFQSGDSGGALLDRRGRLVGVTVGNDGVPGYRQYTFDHSRSVANDALINFARRWVIIHE